MAITFTLWIFLKHNSFRIDDRITFMTISAFASSCLSRNSDYNQMFSVFFRSVELCVWNFSYHFHSFERLDNTILVFMKSLRFPIMTQSSFPIDFHTSWFNRLSPTMIAVKSPSAVMRKPYSDTCAADALEVAANLDCCALTSAGRWVASTSICTNAWRKSRDVIVVLTA
jgi:hypothetical protein